MLLFTIHYFFVAGHGGQWAAAVDVVVASASTCDVLKNINGNLTKLKHRKVPGDLNLKTGVRVRL